MCLKFHIEGGALIHKRTWLISLLLLGAFLFPLRVCALDTSCLNDGPQWVYTDTCALRVTNTPDGSAFYQMIKDPETHCFYVRVEMHTGSLSTEAPPITVDLTLSCRDERQELKLGRDDFPYADKNYKINIYENYDVKYGGITFVLGIEFLSAAQRTSENTISMDLTIETVQSRVLDGEPFSISASAPTEQEEPTRAPDKSSAAEKTTSQNKPAGERTTSRKSAETPAAAAPKRTAVPSVSQTTGTVAQNGVQAQPSAGTSVKTDVSEPKSTMTASTKIGLSVGALLLTAGIVITTAALFKRKNQDEGSQQ